MGLESVCERCQDKYDQSVKREMSNLLTYLRSLPGRDVALSPFLLDNIVIRSNESQAGYLAGLRLRYLGP